MKLVLIISITCVLNSDLVSSELHKDETQLIKAPVSRPQERKDNLFMSITPIRRYNSHLTKIIQSSSLAKQMIDGMNQGSRMIRQVLKRPKMILVPKVKKQTNFRPLSVSAASNHYRFPMKNNYAQSHKKQNEMADEVHETHHHTYSEEHIHINEEDDNDVPAMKEHKKPVERNKSKTNDYLKEIEMREEKRVEAAMSHKIGGSSSEIIHGKPYDFEDDWKPIEKPQPASKLNTFVMDQPIAKQVHHQKHIIEIQFDNKPTSASAMKSTPHKNHIKPTSYSVINFHKQPNGKKPDTSKEDVLATAEAISPDYFFDKKIKDADYLQTNPSNRIETKSRSRPMNEFPTDASLATTTHRHRARPNYSFRINPIETPTVASSSTADDVKLEFSRPVVINERKKHKNLVAHTMKRGAIKFDKYESN